MSECQLANIKNLPRLENLKELDVSTNELQDSSLPNFAKNFPELQKLNIADNKI